MDNPPFSLPAETAGLYDEAHRRAEAVRSQLWRYGVNLPLDYVHPLIQSHVALLQDLRRPESLDWALRLLVRRLFPRDWGDVEGVTAHMSSRGYCELHVWTTKLSGRAMEISIGDRFTGGGKLLSLALHEERSRTHGRPSCSLHVKTPDGSAPAQFVVAALAVTEPGLLEQLASTYEEA